MQEKPTGVDLPDDLTLEKAMQRLEDIVHLLEEDSQTLEDALTAHAEGVALARYCLHQLEEAELRIQELSLED